MAAGALFGAGLGVTAAYRLKHILPVKTPIRAENVRATTTPEGRWRIEEDIVSTDNCRLVLLERRFKDEELDRWVTLFPKDSTPPTMGGGIARANMGAGRYVGWAEYDLAGSNLRRGVYNVTVTASECENSGFEGTYALIPGVPYDFTGQPRPPIARSQLR
jgi:hypothetical protein